MFFFAVKESSNIMQRDLSVNYAARSFQRRSVKDEIVNEDYYITQDPKELKTVDYEDIYDCVQ